MTTPFSTIIITAFITGTNVREDRSVNKYLELGKSLLNIPVIKIAFISTDILHSTNGVSQTWKYGDKTHRWCHDSETNTYYIEFNMSDMYYYGADLSQFSVNTQRPDKDTAEYMMVQNYKPEWMRMGILFDQEIIQSQHTQKQYIWVDFGIRHMFQSDDHLSHSLQQCLSNSAQRFQTAWSAGHPLDAVHFASCHPNPVEWLDVYRDIQWVFAGSVFGGMRSPMLRFAEEAKQECLRIIRERRALMWEVNVWILLKKKYPMLFSLYPCVHDASILYNY